MAYKVPGVYVEEISLFPPSVAEVATAIPAFLGFTEKATKDGEDITNKPTRVTSLLDYEQSFGKDCTLKITGKVDTKKNNAVDVTVERFYLYESLRLFFDNGGGACWIVSLGNYKSVPAKAAFEKGLTELAKYDEPTIIVMPDAVLLDADGLYALQSTALGLCGKLKDRVAVLDLPKGDVSTTVDAFRDGIGINDLKYGAAYVPWVVTAYDKTVPISMLTALKDETGNAQLDLASLVPGDSDYTNLLAEINKGAAPAGSPAPDADAVADSKMISDTITNLAKPDADLSAHFAAAKAAIQAAITAAAADTAAADAAAADKLGVLLQFMRNIATGVVDWRNAKRDNMKKRLDRIAEQMLKPAVDALVAIEKNTEVEALLGRNDANVVADYAPKYDSLAGQWISNKPEDTREDPKHYSNDAAGAEVEERDQALEIANDLVLIFSALNKFVQNVQTAATEEQTPAPAVIPPSSDQMERLEQTLYTRYRVIGNIVRQIKLKMSEVPPGGAVAGVYAYVDSTRGVWKAPANVSLNQVLAPVQRIDDDTQQNLNVDVTGGKSVNAIRAFTGRGNLVWGGRTLAGNDNEWRYINVRRFFNMVEESVKKSTAWAVFEPNAAPLWVKVKGMIENYLIQKWREGALAGARSDDAFYVKIGLGQTMTAQDILEGRLNVEIGMAVVRPAEFIILKFSHIMQKS